MRMGLLISTILFAVYSDPSVSGIKESESASFFRSLEVVKGEGQASFSIVGVFDGVPLYASHSHRNIEIAMLPTALGGLSNVLNVFMQGCCPGDTCPGQTFCHCQSNKDSWSPPPGGTCDGWDYFYCGSDRCQTSSGSCCTVCPDTGPGCYSPPTVLCTDTIC